MATDESAKAASPPCPSDSLVEAAIKILQQPDPWKKAEFTYTAVRLWRGGAICSIRPTHYGDLKAPDRPARSDDKVRVCTPGEVPKRGKGGTLASRQALLHSSVHIENWAVDLSWDIIARFGLQQDVYCLPRQFFDDFVTVAEDECRHFSALAERLQQIGSYYGALPVHDGLWESASTTCHSLPARLAVEHCCHEARGLDVLPATIAKFAKNGDAESAALLRDVIYPEEVNHCAAGVRWLRYLHALAHGRPPPSAKGADHGDGHASGASHGAGGGAANAPAGAAPAPASAAAVASAERLSGLSLSGCGHDAAAASAPQHTPPAATAGTVPNGHPPSTSHSDSDGASNREHDGSAGWRWRGGDPCEPGLPAWAQEALRHGSVEEWFHALVRGHFYGLLKPPFNDEARKRAGFGPEWYLPLTQPAPASAPAVATEVGMTAPEHAAVQAPVAGDTAANGDGI